MATESHELQLLWWNIQDYRTVWFDSSFWHMHKLPQAQHGMMEAPDALTFLWAPSMDSDSFASINVPSLST